MRKARYIDVNTAGAQMLGYSREELLELVDLRCDCSTMLNVFLPRSADLRMAPPSAATGYFVARMVRYFPARFVASNCPTAGCRALCVT